MSSGVASKALFGGEMAGAGELPPGLAACLAGPAGPVEAHRSTWIEPCVFFDDDDRR